MQLDILLRGQSNAILLAEQDHYASIGALYSEVQRLLGFDGKADKIHIVFERANPDGNTAAGGSAFLGDWMQRGADGSWQPGNLENGLLNLVRTHPSPADATAVLWLHSEYDSANRQLTTAEWEQAVRTDAAALRDALGKDAAHAPYLFVSAHPYQMGTDAGHQAIRQGMEDLAADPSFHAQIAARALDIDASIDDQDGNWRTTEYGGGHITPQDGLQIAHRAALSIAEAFAAYAKPGSPIALAGGDIDNSGPQVVQATRSTPDTLLVDVAHDHASGFSALDAAAAAGVGWSVRLGNTVVKADAAQIVDGDTLQLHFSGALPDGGLLHYGYGYGRLADSTGTGEGHAVYDDQGLPIWTPASGLPIDGPAMLEATPTVAEVPAAQPEPVPPRPEPAPETHSMSFGEMLAAKMAAYSGFGF